MRISGKWMILGLLTVSVLLAVYSWWYRYQQTRTVAEFWGGDAARLIERGEPYEALRLIPLGTVESNATSVTETTIEFEGKAYTIAATRDVRAGRGFTNARRALTLRRSYVWEGAPDCAPAWHFGLRFGSPPDSVLLLISSNCPRAVAIESGRTVPLLPRIAKGLAAILLEEFESGQSRDEAAAAETDGP